jgi:cell division protein FtsI (penicillin-binding protein 3)
MSGNASSPDFPLRRHLVVAALVAAALLLAWRAATLTWTHGAFLQQQGDARFLRVVETPAHRGVLRDRHGELLAVSTPVDSVWADPRELAFAREQWPALAGRLGLDVERIHALAAERRGRAFVYLRRHVEPHVADEVRALEVRGVGFEREYRRYYPDGEVAAHVLGFTDVDDRGQEGLELAFDGRLQGTPGARRVVQDRLGREVEAVERLHAPVPGDDIRTSLDRRLQYLAYRALKAAVARHRARGGSVVVLDPRTGEVLAMVNQPAYNPNDRGARTSDRIRNRAVTDVVEPGSTVKPFTILAGLAAGYRPETPLDTRPGLLRVGRLTVRDHRDYGVIDLATALQKSSNVAASRIALSVPREVLWRVMDLAGFGLPTGSGFPGEAAGILTDYARWGEIHRATLSYGYGLSVTALQLARAYGVLAADGVRRPVTFERLEDTPPGERVYDAALVRQVRGMLEGVVAEEGTGAHARVAGYRVAGKTGTVHKSVAGGYAEDRYTALFAGIVPASDPHLVVVVVVDEPRASEYYGGQVAAPVFAEVAAGALRTLGVAPDGRAPDAVRLALEARMPPAAGEGAL